ncbi:hypothetical protein NDU88_003534 [Pleurodeles waltl]|uniref:Uncharacterized protein n=1 Tax=Pleurodeles waltl TaxID=8319 RepID=A0AAV7NKX4_PLEWA|nr:hypothetical protein NDU88_003534 [Pleurodeles waltl]
MAATNVYRLVQEDGLGFFRKRVINCLPEEELKMELGTAVLPTRSPVLQGATTIEKYDLRTNVWIQAGVMNGRRLQFGVAVIDDKLYVIGGRDGLKTLNTVESYNPKSRIWTVLPPMSTHRHGLGESSPSLFASGGALAWHAPSAGVSRRIPHLVSEAAGFPKFERLGGTSSRSLYVRATPPGTAEGAPSELRPRRSPRGPLRQPAL